MGQGGRLTWRWMALCLPAVLAACITVPQYDDQTDKLITQVQTDADTKIISLIALDDEIQDLSKQTDAASQKDLSDAKTKASYRSASAFYQKIDVDLITLKTRIDAEPTAATPHLDSAWQQLHDNLLAPADSMKAIHKRDDIIPASELRTMQQLVDAQAGALLTRELSLKNAKPAQ